MTHKQVALTFGLEQLDQVLLLRESQYHVRLQRVIDNLVDLEFGGFALSYYVDILWRGCLSLLLTSWCCCLLWSPTLLHEGDVGLRMIQKSKRLLNDFGDRSAIRKLYRLGALQGIAVNVDLVCTVIVVSQDSMHTPLFQLRDHLWCIFKLLLAVDADLLESTILIAQAN